MKKKLVSIVIPCFNEVDNVNLIYLEIKNIIKDYKESYNFEIIFIDNKSNDGTREILREMSLHDKNVKLIFNARNFGVIKSPYHGLLSASGDACILLCADLQEPPELIVQFLMYWKEGFDIVAGVRDKPDDRIFIKFYKDCYYTILENFTSHPPIRNFTGFGLYSRKVLNILKNLEDRNPFLRGIISQLGFPVKRVSYEFKYRVNGKTKNNYSVLYDYMLLGLMYHTKTPLRFIFISGLVIFFVSGLISIIFLILKIINWDSYASGNIPILLGVFMLGGLNMLFLGIVGEYLGYIISRMDKFPLVIEEERVNFENNDKLKKY